jgi:hypothetical protein
MATTTNYGWTTPNDTDLVKDGAAAIRTLGSSIDTTVFNNASAGIAKTIVDAKGDIIAATAADTVARLAVGANNSVLTADSAEATGLKWASPAADNWALISSTNLPTGASSLTISSIPLRKSLMILCGSVQTGASSIVTMRINGDTAANYTSFGTRNEAVATYTASAFNQAQLGSETSFNLFRNNNGSGNEGVISVLLDSTNSTGFKTYQSVSAGGSSGGGTANRQQQLIGFYAGTSVVSSITITSSVGNFAAAQPVLIYGTV